MYGYGPQDVLGILIIIINIYMQLQNHIREISHESSFEDGASQIQQSNIMQAQIPSELQNQKEFEYSVSQQNCNAPLSQFSNSFSVFCQKRKATDIRTFIRLKSDHQFLQTINEFYQYMQIKSVSLNSNLKIQGSTDKNKQNHIPDQFFYCSEIPKYCTFVVTIKPLMNGRCNIEVFNLSGFSVGYFNSIKIVKKFYKIYKLVQKLPKPYLLIVQDDIPTNKFQYSYFKKIQQKSDNYLYIINNYTQNLLTVRSQMIHPNQLVQLSQNQMLKRVNEKTYYFSKVFGQDHSEAFLKSLQKSKKQIFSHLGLVKSQQQRNLSFDALIINTSLLYEYKSDDIKNKILQIFQMNQQKIACGNQQIRFGEEKWHTPEAMKQCRDCLYCSKYRKLNKKKTKFRCEGCSAKNKREIPLCILCFKKFHLNKKIQLSLLRNVGGKSKRIKKQKETLKIKSQQDQDLKNQDTQGKAQYKKVPQIKESQSIQSHSFQVRCQNQRKQNESNDLQVAQISCQSDQKQKLGVLKKAKTRFQYLKDLKELSELRQSIFSQIEGLKRDLKYEVAKESLELFVSRIILTMHQLQEKMGSLSTNNQ